MKFNIELKIQPSTMCLILIIFLTTLISATSAECPVPCKCQRILDSFEADCSGLGLTEYPFFDDASIEQVNLSHNNFTEFPSDLWRLERLQHLDLSNNKIAYLAEGDLVGFRSLRTLDLSNNSFSKWKDLAPSKVFVPAVKLQKLSLAGNAIQSYAEVDETILLISESLTTLDISYCKLAKPVGEFMLSGLPNLERLILHGNALQSLVAFPKSGIKSLDLSECSLTRLGAKFMSNLDDLEELNLSNNPGLLYGSQLDEVMRSDVLEYLDLSMCNMDSMEIEGFPNLVTLKFRTNMIRRLTKSTFQSNTEIEVLDLSQNAISVIEPAAFASLHKLTELNLSFNSIGQIDANWFKSNLALTVLNLSHNFVAQFNKIASSTLRKVDLSWNIIAGVSPDAFTGLAAVRELDMSNNFLSILPNTLKSSTLQKWDLSMCRLSAINNNTFRGFPELSSLKLSGNRFTNPFSIECFESNGYLDNIWLGDNPWICDCGSDDFKEFYAYLTERPAKIKDNLQLRCASPQKFYGQSWDSACRPQWQPSQNQTSSSPSQVLAFITFAVLVMMICVLIAGCIKKCYRERSERRNQREYFRNSQELRDVRRANQRMLDHEAQLNAPDPRESNPPCYEDALLMPKLERSFKSMDELSTRRISKRMIRSKTEVGMVEGLDEEVLDDIIIDSHRYRSVDMLSNRCKERTAFVNTFRRTGMVQTPTSGSRVFSSEESRFPPAHIKAQNLQSAEQIANFQSYENSPYTKRKQKHDERVANFKRASMRDSIEFLTDSECQSIRDSPFARRKPKGSTYSILSVHSAKVLLPPVEDYFKEAPSTSQSSGSNDFQIMATTEVDIESLPDSESPARSLRSEVVVVHNPNRSSEI